MRDTKIETLIERLLEKGRAGELAWEPTINPEVFQAAFAQYAVRVFPASASSSEFVIQLLNQEGDLIENVSSYLLDSNHPDFRNRTRLQELHSLARRRAMGVDAAIDTILRMLDQDKTVDPDKPES